MTKGKISQGFFSEFQLFSRIFGQKIRNFLDRSGVFWYFQGIKSILNAISCICPVRETSPFVCSKKKLESFVQFFCVLSSVHIPKLFENSETKHLQFFIFLVYGMWQKLPYEKFKKWACETYEKLWLYRFGQKIQQFPQTCSLISGAGQNRWFEMRQRQDRRFCEWK